MYKLFSIMSGLAGAGSMLLLSVAGANALNYGTDYRSFEGVLIVLDNPTSSGCQTLGINYGSRYRAVYRFTATTPSVLSDDLTLFTTDSAAKMLSQASNGSLNGTSSVIWEYINHKGDSNSDAFTASSTLTISSGQNAPVTVNTGNIKILGSINGFLANQTCNISSVHAALVSVPN